jgi:hypothetical protein
VGWAFGGMGDAMNDMYAQGKINHNEAILRDCISISRNQLELVRACERFIGDRITRIAEKRAAAVEALQGERVAIFTATRNSLLGELNAMMAAATATTTTRRGALGSSSSSANGGNASYPPPTRPLPSSYPPPPPAIAMDEGAVEVVAPPAPGIEVVEAPRSFRGRTGKDKYYE